jgi:hypothetical protein
MIVEFVTRRIIYVTETEQYLLYYKDDYETHFNKISVTYEQLKLFLETYGYETNNTPALQKFGVNTKNIKYNLQLKR